MKDYDYEELDSSFDSGSFEVFTDEDDDLFEGFGDHLWDEDCVLF